MAQLNPTTGDRQTTAGSSARAGAGLRRPSGPPSSRPNGQGGRTLEAAEEACRRGEDLVRTIIDSTRAVVYLKDPEGRYRLINRRWAELFGVTQESVVGQTDHDIFPPEIADAFRSHDVEILAGGHAVELEEVAPHEDGPHTYLSVKVPLIGQDGVPYALCGISTDITDRKRMEEALRLGEERFRGAFEAAVIGMALVDPEGRWLRVNSALREIVGYTEPELLGSTSQAITHPDDLEADLESRRRLLSGEIDSCQLEKRYLRKGGEVVWVRLSVTLVRELGGRPLHLVALVEDVTPRKRAEERAAALHAELQEAYDATIAGWARALDLRDHETEGHSRRVTEVTLRLARALGLPEADLVHVRRGALLHDIGKMGVPDSVLLKPGKLTEDEQRVMRKHPDLAVEMLAPIEFLRPALDIPRCHHERWDGTGYPRGLVGEEIPLAARAFAAVDIWDALTHDRPYRAAWPADRARAYLRSLAGTHLDPAVVAAFLRLDPTDPPGAEEPVPSLVESPRPRPEGSRPRAAGRVDDPVTDPARLAVLRDTGLMDSPAEPSFDRLVQLARKVLRTPVAMVSLVDDRRQFFKSGSGLPEPWCSLRETPLSHSFCREVVRSAAPLIVPDARLDPRVHDNRAIRELGIIAYAGMPLTTTAGHVLGSFCIIDDLPRLWSEDELGILGDLAASVMTEIELRRDIAARRRVEEELRRSQWRVAEQLRIATGLNRELEERRREMDLANDRLVEMAMTDGLTGLRNRHHFDAALMEAHASASRRGTPLSVILADVDEFKKYNDAFGHPAGDEVLRGVASTLAGQLRGEDLAARYGGEEFVILLPETDAAEAGAVAERLRVALESRTWPGRGVTASFGVATSAAGGDEEPWTLVSRADVALYLSKERGRNRVTHHDVGS
jgi:diguanylate cyclase (GGDEF)-like protein/PAS domain S-box-containing protein/putative nucleotidyltransferase with HDIG domain